MPHAGKKACFSRRWRALAQRGGPVAVYRRVRARLQRRQARGRETHNSLGKKTILETVIDNRANADYVQNLGVDDAERLAAAAAAQKKADVTEALFEKSDVKAPDA